MSDKELAEHAFLDELRKEPDVRIRQYPLKYNPSTKLVITNSGEKVIWLKYSKYAGNEATERPPYYGGSVKLLQELIEDDDHPLFLVFLGKQKGLYWVIPAKDFLSNNFTLSHTRDNKMWKFNFDHQSNRNAISDYDTLQPLLD